MLAGVRENKTELNTQIGGPVLVYISAGFEAKINADAAALAEALEILEYERQTWQLVCEKLSSGERGRRRRRRISAAYRSDTNSQR